MGSFEKNRLSKTDHYEPYKGDAQSFLDNLEHEGDAALFGSGGNTTGEYISNSHYWK